MTNENAAAFAAAVEASLPSMEALATAIENNPVMSYAEVSDMTQIMLDDLKEPMMIHLGDSIIKAVNRGDAHAVGQAVFTAAQFVASRATLDALIAFDEEDNA